jgi:transposase-like protein
MEFAAEIGVNAGTLRQWKYRFNRGQGDPARRARPADVASFVEVQTRSTAAHVGMFQLELGGERRLHIPSNFDEAALRRLLSLLVQS